MNEPAVSDGSPEPLGVRTDAAGVNVAVHSAHADAIVFCLFDADDREIEKIPLPARTGEVFHGHIGGVEPGARYGLRAYGPWDPAHGHRFNPAKLLLDPFATTIDRPFRLHPSLFDGDADSSAVRSSAAASISLVTGANCTALPAPAANAASLASITVSARPPTRATTGTAP